LLQNNTINIITFHHWLYQTRSSHTSVDFAFLLIIYADRNKTDSHRFKPNSCNVLIDEQSNHF